MGLLLLGFLLVMALLFGAGVAMGTKFMLVDSFSRHHLKKLPSRMLYLRRLND
jgi:hypothetical protein